jgi:hypothetical protein
VRALDFEGVEPALELVGGGFSDFLDFPFEVLEFGFRFGDLSGERRDFFRGGFHGRGMESLVN